VVGDALRSSRARRRARLELASLRARARGLQVAHFLHPGKTAGTALKAALRDATPPPHHELALHTHGVRMVDLPERDVFFFVVRDPVDRFVSAFNSRLRKGRPRFERPWSPGEARAFARFPTAQALAVGLDGDIASRAAAIDALMTIEHVRRSYWYWFSDPETFRARLDRVLFVGFQETLDRDIADLSSTLGIAPLALPADVVTAHRSTAATPALSDGARATMARWYSADYAFVDLCRSIRRLVR
jgi:hypothetical protein